MEKAINDAENPEVEYILGTSFLKTDSVEFTVQWEEIIDEVEYKIWTE